MRGGTLYASDPCSLIAEREKADLANRHKSEFVANYKSRNSYPAERHLLGMTEALSSSPLNPEQQRNLEVLQRAEQGLLRLVNEILDLSR